MLPVSQIWQISTTVDAEWRSPIADAVAAAWGLPAGAARWLRSSATHVFIAPGREGDTPSYLRFAPSASLAGEKLSSSAPLMADWADRSLGAVRPLPSVNGQLTEVVKTPRGDVTAMLVPAAPGAEVSVDHLRADQAMAWGTALAHLHREGSAGIFCPFRMPAGQDVHTGHDMAGFDEPLMRAIAAAEEKVADLDPVHHSQGICHGDFELDNIRFGPAGPAFFDADEAHHGWFAADVALAVRDLTGVTLGSAERPELLGAFLSGYRSRRPFSEEEEQSLPLHSLAASARLLRQLEGVLDAGRGDTDPEWVRDLHASLLEHQSWHRQRLLGETSQPTLA